MYLGLVLDFSLWFYRHIIWNYNKKPILSLSNYSVHILGILPEILLKFFQISLGGLFNNLFYGNSFEIFQLFSSKSSSEIVWKSFWPFSRNPSSILTEILLVFFRNLTEKTSNIYLEFWCSNTISWWFFGKFLWYFFVI